MTRDLTDIDLRFSRYGTSFISSYGCRVRLRGHWLDNQDCFTFYASRALTQDVEQELQQIVPYYVKIGSWGFDIPKDSSFVPLSINNFIA